MKEVTYEDWQKNTMPRMMWCWNSSERDKVPAKVISVVKTNACIYPVLSIMKGDVGYETFRHCAEIEEIKTRRMTNKEFTLWLLEGIREGRLRQWRRINSNTVESVPCGYASGYENLLVENKLIREDGGEWHEPLVEV